MKQIHELSERVTALGLGDVLAVDNGNDTEKIDYTKLAKAIIEQYNLSSLGGSNRTLKVTLDALQDSVDDDLVPKSDIVNNVTTSAAGKVLDASQGKALQDQVTALNSSLSLFSKGTNISDSSYNLDNIRTPGAYYVSSTTQNFPTGAVSTGHLLVYGLSDSVIRVCQILVDSQGTIFTRNWTGSWSAWIKQPTRSEYNALNSKLGFKYIIQPGGTLSLSGNNGTLPNAYILVTRGSMTNLLNVYIGTGYGATAIRHRMTALFTQGSDISVAISDSAYGLTIVNNTPSTSLEVYVTNITNVS